MNARENINQRITDVREDREHGSRWLVRNAIMAIRDLAIFDIAPQDEHMRQLYAVSAVPLVLGMILLQITVFIGIASSELDDAVLEWWSRCGAWRAKGLGQDPGPALAVG